MDGLERSVRLGLVALAVSDMLFCFLYLLSTWIPYKAKYSPYDNLLTLYFKIYQEGLINTFQLSSTWLTVNMALGRYIAICHPLHARGYIRPRGTRVAVLVILVASAVFNAPRFCHYRPRSTACHLLLMFNGSASESHRLLQLTPPPDCHCFYYSKAPGWLYTKAPFLLGYGLACSLVEIFLPLLLLTVCNVCLIRALRRSYRMQSLYRCNQKPVDSSHRITPTLIALIVLFTILVTPSNVIAFVRTASGTFHTFQTATRLANFLLLSNFAVNFVLYLVVNAEFRRVTRDLLTCRRAAAARGLTLGAERSGYSEGGRSQRWRSERSVRGGERGLQQGIEDDQYSMVAAKRGANAVETDVLNMSPTEMAL